MHAHACIKGDYEERNIAKHLTHARCPQPVRIHSNAKFIDLFLQFYDTVTDSGTVYIVHRKAIMFLVNKYDWSREDRMRPYSARRGTPCVVSSLRIQSTKFSRRRERRNFVHGNLAPRHVIKPEVSMELATRQWERRNETNDGFHVQWNRWVTIHAATMQKESNVSRSQAQAASSFAWRDIPKSNFFQVKRIFNYTSSRHSHTKNVLFCWEVAPCCDSIYLQ